MCRHSIRNQLKDWTQLTVLENNERAKHLYEKCGFKFEGVKRKSNYKNGMFVNMWMYSILKEEFKGGGELTQFKIVCCMPSFMREAA